MNNCNNQVVDWWRKSDRMTHRLMDWIIITLGVTVAFSVCRVTVQGLGLSSLWTLILCFYFFFYRRMAQAIYWSANTFHLLRNHQFKPASKLLNQSSCTQNLPSFHVLIAAYEAGASIGPVIKAIANQDYPHDQFSVWIITEHSEQLKTDNRVKESSRTALAADTERARLPGLLPLFWRSLSQELSSFDAWATQVTRGKLRSYLRSPGISSVFLEDLLSRLIREDRQALYAAGALDRLHLSQYEQKILENELRQTETAVAGLAADFTRLLGSDSVYQRADIERQVIGKAINSCGLKKISRRLCQRFAQPQGRFELPDAETIERAVKLMNPSTQDVIRQVFDELHQTGLRTNLRHLDPSNRGFKPGALNVAYRQIRAEGFLKEPENVYFIIIDADSLLPAHALREIAHELQKVDVPAIMQMTSIPTANFFDGGWYSKFISFADAVGAVGKWARSTRRQLKPDLQAGSGVVIPATLSHFVEAQTGFAWDENTLTEDARLIIGQFGMMNGVRNKTRMAPVFLLEAVPANETFWRTYQSFWNQRRRWSAGGFDEFFYMLRCPRWIRHSRFNQSTKRWEVYTPQFIERVKIRARQLHRTGLWLWDHFIWGIGGFIVLTHWWLISIAIGAPSSAIRAAGLLALLLTPALFIAISGRQLSWFAPGGLTPRRKCLLYLQSYVAIWLYCLPAVVTQCICILGFRSQIVEWKPTQKPRYQLGAR